MTVALAHEMARGDLAPIRVALVSADLLEREGMLRVLENEAAIEIVAFPDEQGDAFGPVEEHDPDVVVAYIGPSSNCLDVARALRRRYPDVGLVVLSNALVPELAATLLEHGSRRLGLLLRDALRGPGELVVAIRDVAAGGSAVDPVVLEDVVTRQLEKAASPLNELTPRERDVLAELATGKSNAAVARALQISKRSVEHYVGAIFSKLDLPSEDDVSRRVAATLLYLERRGPSRSGSPSPVTVQQPSR